MLGNGGRVHCGLFLIVSATGAAHVAVVSNTKVEVHKGGSDRALVYTVKAGVQTEASSSHALEQVEVQTVAQTFDSGTRDVILYLMVRPTPLTCRTHSLV